MIITTCIAPIPFITIFRLAIPADYRLTKVTDICEQISVSTEVNCRRISSVIVHRSARDKLAVDSIVMIVCGLSLTPSKRERLFLLFLITERSVNGKLVSGKVSKGRLLKRNLS